MNPEQWRTYLVTQESLSAGRSSREVVTAAIEGGIDAVQLREKGVDARSRYALGLELRELTAETDVALLVNDRIDLARAIDADGVHLGTGDLPVEVAREALGPDAVVGYSASTVEEAVEGERAGADYLGVGAVYGTSSKADVPEENDGIGTDRVAEIVDRVGIPVIGIGGITAENAPAVREAGAAGIAVISAITAAEEPATATERLREAVTDV